MAHGFKADKDEQGIYANTAEELCRNGFTVLRFDFAGSGESNGKFVDMTLTSEAEDLKSAIKFMRSGGCTKIGLIGNSFGGTVSILGWSKEIGAMVLWNPKTRKGGFSSLYRADKNWRIKLESKGYFELYAENTKRFYRVGKPLINELDSIDIFSEAEKIKAPTLILHGDKDTHTPIADTVELMKHLKNGKLEIIKNAEHGFHDPASEKIVIKFTVEWFRKYLNNPESAGKL
jgi:alpha-beta hydrolase superfamily lysophospholipase